MLSRQNRSAGILRGAQWPAAVAFILVCCSWGCIMKNGYRPGIRTWLNSAFQVFTGPRGQNSELRQATELIVDIADPSIRRVGSYQRQLRPSVATAIDYCTSLVASIVGPLSLNSGQYHADPRVRAFFTSPRQVDEVLQLAGRTWDMNSLQGQDECVALLTMDMDEKTVFSHQRHGKMMLGESARRVVNFSDHHLVLPSPSLEKARNQLINRGLEVLATVAMKRITAIRGDLAELRERRERLQSMLRILGGSRHTRNIFSVSTQEETSKIRTIKKELADIMESIETERSKIESPRKVLTLLQEAMESPEQGLIAANQTLNLDWMNVISDSSETGEGDVITYTMLSVPDELQRSAVLVKVKSSDL